MLGENMGQQSFVPDIPFKKGQLLAGKLLDTLQTFRIGIAQIVDDDHAVAAFQQLQTGMGTDIAGTAGNKNVHSKPSNLYDSDFIVSTRI